MMDKIERGLKLFINQYLFFYAIVIIISYITNLKLVFNHFGYLEILGDLIPIILIIGSSLYFSIRREIIYLFHLIYVDMILYCIILTQCYIQSVVYYFSYAIIGIIFYGMLDLVFDNKNI